MVRRRSTPAGDAGGGGRGGPRRGEGVNIQLPLTPSRSGYIYNATSYFLLLDYDSHYRTCELDFVSIIRHACNYTVRQFGPKSAMSSTSPARRPPVDVSSVRHVGLFNLTFLLFSLSLALLLHKECIYIGIKHHLFVYT